MKKLVHIFTAILICALTACACLGCNAIAKGNTSDSPDYAWVDGHKLSFTLELRNVGSGSEKADGDAFAHSTTDGELIASWQIDCFGNTVYESVNKYFEDKDEKITFALSQRKFYLFDSATLKDGSTYSLKTAYVSADGKYATCANYQTLFGQDGIAGTVDDLKVLVLVYKGWLY